MIISKNLKAYMELTIGSLENVKFITPTYEDVDNTRAINLGNEVLTQDELSDVSGDTIKLDTGIYTIFRRYRNLALLPVKDLAEIEHIPDNVVVDRCPIANITKLYKYVPYIKVRGNRAYYNIKDNKFCYNMNNVIVYCEGTSAITAYAKTLEDKGYNYAVILYFTNKNY